jgi:hypothetical protein
MTYPTDRKKTGYAIRFIKALLNSDALRDYGSDVVMLAILIASTEDKLHYSKAPRFWRNELMNRFGKSSPNWFVRVRDSAINAGLIHHTPATRTHSGEYWTLVPDWLSHEFEPYQNHTGSDTANGIPYSIHTGSDTASDTASDTLSITLTHNPCKGGKPSRPSVEEIDLYSDEYRADQQSKDKVWPVRPFDSEAFLDHYTANGWKQSNGNPIKDWKAAVRNWGRRDFPSNSNGKPRPDNKPLLAPPPRRAAQ